MKSDLIHKLLYSYSESEENYSLPLPIKDSFQLISNFFANNSNNKLCLVFPSKEFAAQWLSIPTVLFLIEKDFEEFKGEIFESYRQYRPGDKLILNNLAIVEWVGIKQNGVAFKTKGVKESSGAEITIRFSDVIMLQKAPINRRVLSSLKSVKEALPSRNITPLEKLLDIDTYGNEEFMKTQVCLVTKYKSFDDSIDNLVMNKAMLPEYFDAGRIDDNGVPDFNSPLLLAKNFFNLALYLVAKPIAKIIIDGFSAIEERGTDFSDIDVKNIPTILITDLSEIESFESIDKYGFEFFNFTKDNFKLDHLSGNSPFHAFNKKLKKYLQFNLKREICQNSELEAITQKIHSIEKDDSNNDLVTLKVYLIQLTNLVSRICHILTSSDNVSLDHRLKTVDNLFQRNKMWLGDSHKPIEESISLLKSVIENFTLQPSEKCARLKSLMSQHEFDYIICATESEAQELKSSIGVYPETQIISIADVNDDLLSNKPVNAILTGWPKSNNINRLLSSFLFSELTVLFYQYENKYFDSLQRRNRKYSDNIKSTITNKGVRPEGNSEKSKGFVDLYSEDGVSQKAVESSFDILEFELKLDNAQYSKYKAKGNLIESIKARRVDFESDLFIYSSESHKFLVISELIERKGEKANLHRKKLDVLKPGDVIALINTDRDILAELVEKNTNKQDLGAIKQWTDLWKNLLKEYLALNGNDFKKLVDGLRKNDCKKHEATIRTWLQDPTRIGPEDDADLISIALLTGSNLLNDNIKKVRESITKMKGLRHEASDLIIQKITTKIHEFADSSIINKRISIEGLGRVTVSKVVAISNTWETIDVRYANRQLQKEII